MIYAIIAAGEGSRLCKEGITVAKPLVSINGTPLIRRLIDTFSACNAESIAVVINGRTPEVEDYLLRLASTHAVELKVTVKDTPSSMHSFHELSHLLPRDRKFILTTVDTVFAPRAFAAYAAAFAADSSDCCHMAVTDYIDDEKPLYVSVDSTTGMIDAFSDKPLTACRYISGGIYGLTPQALDILDLCISRGDSRMRNYQRALLAAGIALKPCPMGKIIDVDHTTDIAEANRMTASSAGG